MVWEGNDEKRDEMIGRDMVRLGKKRQEEKGEESTGCNKNL